MRPDWIGEATQHITNVRPLPFLYHIQQRGMRQRWRKNKEKELSRQNLEGNTWESTRSKEKASIAAITGKAAVLGRHWRNEQVMMKLVLRVSWEKSCKGARWGVALCWGAGSTARRGRTSPQTTGSGPAHLHRALQASTATLETHHPLWGHSSFWWKQTEQQPTPQVLGAGVYGKRLPA